MEDSQKVARAKSFANQLRRLADKIKQHPLDIPLPDYNFVFDVWVHEKEELAAFARATGKVKKTYGDDWIEFDWQVGDLVRFRANIAREKVCQRVETGEEEYIPEHVTPARIIKKTKWVCDDPAFLPPDDNEPAVGGR